MSKRARHPSYATSRDLERVRRTGALSVALLASFTAHPAALAGSAMIAVTHLVGATECAWPARDREQLATFVVPEGSSKRLLRGFPSRTTTLAVAFALFAMAAGPLSIAVGASWRWPARLVAAVFLARGLFGLRYRGWSPLVSRPPFAQYNRLFYSPGCLLVAAVVALEAI